MNQEERNHTADCIRSVRNSFKKDVPLVKEPKQEESAYIVFFCLVLSTVIVATCSQKVEVKEVSASTVISSIPIKKGK